MLHERWKGHKGFAPTFEEVTEFPGRMAQAAAWSDLTGKDRPDKPWLNGRPRMIFVSDMSDAFSVGVSFEYLIDEIIDVVRFEKGSRHRWLWLTKRPERMLAFAKAIERLGGDWPSNLWAGTSITSRKTFNRYRALTKMPCPIFLSVEPQIELLDLNFGRRKPDWIIQGGESGKEARPFQIDWADIMRRQCRTWDIPYFLKQLGANPVFADGQPFEIDDPHGSDWSKWPYDMRVREVPKMGELS